MQLLEFRFPCISLSSPPERRLLGDCTHFSCKRTVLTKWWARTHFLPWRAGRNRVTQTKPAHLDALNPRFLLSLVIPIFIDQPIAWQPQDRVGCWGRWVDKEYLQSFRAQTQPRALYCCTILPSPLYRWRNWSRFLSVQWRLRNIYLHDGKPVYGTAPPPTLSTFSLAGFLF